MRWCPGLLSPQVPLVRTVDRIDANVVFAQASQDRLEANLREEREKVNADIENR